MRRLGSLIVFLAVGLAIAWFTRNSGRSGGTAFLIAFVPALVAAWLFERFVMSGPKKGP